MRSSLWFFTAGYGFANFGYLHVNQTLESTSNAMRYYLNHLNTDNRDWENNKRKEILNNYYNNASQREVFLATVNNADEDFENGSNFLNHWYFDHNYFNNDARTERISLSHCFGKGKEDSCQLTVEAVSNLLYDVPVDFYIALNLDGISELNDLLGGIEVTLEIDR